MNDHETYLLLAAKRVNEPLTPGEEAALEEHLARCPSCRAMAAGMRRDDIILRAALHPVAVSPRVRERVLDEAAGGRRLAAGRLILPLAAALVIVAISVPLIAGALRPPEASGIPSPIATVPPSPSLALSPTPVSSASVSPSVPAESAQASPTDAGFVNGSYTYNEPNARRDAISAHFEDGRPVGAWSRIVPPTGESDHFGGPITCLVIAGDDAWMAGPATVATDGRKDAAAFIHVHDGGSDGKNDRAVLWLSNPGQSLTLLEGWCRTRYIPVGPFPLNTGDVEVVENP
jgi:Putative zinc-finger